MNTITTNDSPLNFFKENLSKALSENHVQASDYSIFYVADMMNNSTTTKSFFKEGKENLEKKPLAFFLKDALEGDSFCKYEKLKTIGDFSLAVSGFFQENLKRYGRPNLVGYYSELGAKSYDSMSSLIRASPSSELFEELADSFGEFRDALRLISLRNQPQTPEALFQMFRNWDFNKDSFLEKELKRRGVSTTIN